MRLSSTSLVLSSLPLLSGCLAPPFSGYGQFPQAQLFGQQPNINQRQSFQQQQKPVFETDGYQVDYQEADFEDDGWSDWLRDKYAVRDPFDDDFDRMVEETLQHWHVPGLSVAVVHGDATFAKGYGKASLPDVPATPDTLYYVGSTTKSFTAAAILLLIEDSRLPSSGANNLPPDLDLTTPVSSLIRDEFVLPDAYATSKATLEDLLTHRTGMPRHDFSYDAGDANTTTLRSHVEKLRHLPLTAELRTAWQYCNMMYTTLAYVLETLTSTTWAEFVSARIWRPLALTNTFASLAAVRRHPTAPARLSTPYYWCNRTRAFRPEPYLPDATALTGAGNVISSVADYAKYLRAMLRRRPNFFPGSAHGFRELRRAARSVVSDEEEDDDDGDNPSPWSGPELYGLAWTLRAARRDGLRVYAHTGSVTGYAALMAYAPRAGWAVAVMANAELRGGWAADRVAARLVEDLVGTPPARRWDALRAIDARNAAARDARTRARELLWPGAPPREGGDAAPGWLPLRVPLDALAGVFENPGYGRVEFGVVEGEDGDGGGGGRSGGKRHLHADVTDKLWRYAICLEHVSGEHFLAWLGPTEDFPSGLFDHEMPLRARFDVGVDGNVDRLLLGLEPRMGDEMMVFERVRE